MAGRASSKPIERVVALAAYLHKCGSHPPKRADIVADVPGYPEGNEANRKALRRDLADLEKYLGIGTEYDDVEDSYRLVGAFLTPKERDALVAAAAVAHVQGLGDPEPDDIGGAVDPNEHRVFVTVPLRVFALCESIRSRTAVTFGYHGTARTLHAYALGERNANWYVTGLEQESGERRQFRIDRIEGDVQAAGVPGAYEVPDDFDATAAILGVDPFTWGPDPRVVARVWLGADHAYSFTREYGGSVVESDEHGAVVEVSVAHYNAFRWRLLSFGDHAHVLSPPVLVEHVRSHLAAIAGG